MEFRAMGKIIGIYLFSMAGFAQAALPDLEVPVPFNNITSDGCHYDAAWLPTNHFYSFVTSRPDVAYDTLVIRLESVIRAQLGGSNYGLDQVGTIRGELFDFWVHAGVEGMNHQHFGADFHQNYASADLEIGSNQVIRIGTNLSFIRESAEIPVNVAQDIADVFPVRLTCYGAGGNQSVHVTSGSVNRYGANYTLKNNANVVLVWKDRFSEN